MAEKKQPNPWIVIAGLGVIIGMLVVVIFLQATGGCERKEKVKEPETTIVEDTTKPKTTPTKTRVFNEGKEILPEPADLIGSAEYRDFIEQDRAWRDSVEIREIEIVPGRWTIDVAYPWGIRSYHYKAPQDLYYTFWAGWLGDTLPEAWYRKLPQPAPVKARRTILWIEFEGGATWQEIERPDTSTTWGIRPDFSVGLTYTPWSWLRLTPARFSYTQSTGVRAGAYIGISIPIARR